MMLLDISSLAWRKKTAVDLKQNGPANLVMKLQLKHVANIIAINTKNHEA
jgi:hypothetical protein